MTPTTRKRPRAERIAEELIDSIPSETKEDFTKAAYFAVRHLVEAKRAMNEFMHVLATGLEVRDPEILLAAVQTYQDGLVKSFPNRDPGFARSLDQADKSHVLYMLDQLTDGQLVIETSDNFYTGRAITDAVSERLRKVATSVLATPINASNLHDILATADELEQEAFDDEKRAMENEASSSTPKM